MSHQVDIHESENWQCGKCGADLEPTKVEVGYMEANTPWSCPRAPNAALCFVPEELALGKMVEVEKILEDK